MTFSLGHLPGISDSLCSRWSTQLSPETRPFSQAYYLVIHPDTQTRVLPTPQAVIHHVPLFQTTHCYLITILSGEDISTIVLIGLPAANLAHFHFITQLEWSLNNKNQIVPTPHLKQANNFSSFWEKKIPTQCQTDTAPSVASSEIRMVTASLPTGPFCPVWLPSLLRRCCTWEHSPGNLPLANLYSEFRTWANWLSYEVLYSLAPAQCLVLGQWKLSSRVDWLSVCLGRRAFCMKWSALGMCLVTLRGVVRRHPR